MMGPLALLAVMVAAVRLVLPLPLGDGDAGKALRRAAGFAFVMAFVPATLFCLASPLFRRPHSPAAAIELLLAGFGAIGGLVVLSLAAYPLIGPRKAPAPPPSPPATRFPPPNRQPDPE